ncbi:MAG: DUF1553 domain-containing protein [Planctomycetes bacterium]|nr:DUF1553 domain-containing protein [Planctomycetota bacterium]
MLGRQVAYLWLFVAIVFLIDGSLVVQAVEQIATPDFEQEVVPLLIRRCLECHQESDSSGGLSLASKAGLLQGGDSGPAIALDATEESYLLERVIAGEMPPEKKGIAQKLSADEIALLERWVQTGANWPENRTLDLYEKTSDVRGGRDWWSLLPVLQVTPPKVRRADLVSNPIDNFVLAKLEAADMEPAPLAGKRELIRRIYFDVIGLPPSFQQIKAFVADQRPDAWERTVNELLASPQYGERWARHWLDLVRFAETSGYERDQEKPFAWRYRDWVVDSLNEDKPYDRFVLEQLAGDELPDRTEQSVIATGLLRLGTWNDEPNDPQDYKYERLEDLVHVTSSAFLGLVVKCARCHDHKFDPIPQLDYYRLAAIFWPGAIEPRGRELLGGPTSEELGYDNVLGWTDLTTKPVPLHLLKQGDRHKPGEIAEAGALTAVSVLDRSFEPPSAGAASTERRLQFARWVVNPQNPLTARVIVNRLWQHHFGAGLVRTPNNFGYRGALPTHPQLLDWLATEFVQGGWKTKAIHKKILMSRVYRQSSVHPRFDEYQLQDAANQLWWHAKRYRLDAEALRDAMLQVTGELDPTRGGPSFRPTMDASALEGLSQKEAAWHSSPAQQQLRRSLYMFSKRSLLLPMMTTFNFSDTISPCGQRDVTIAPTQALALLNNAFAHERSMALARRVASSGASDRLEQVQSVWRFTLGRDPKPEEEQLAVAHLAQQQDRFEAVTSAEATPELLSLASLCHVVLNSNEFIYVD